MILYVCSLCFATLLINITLKKMFKGHFCTEDFGSTFNRQWEGHVYDSYSDSKHARGMCILIRKESIVVKCDLTEYKSSNKCHKNMLYCPFRLTKYTEVANH